MIRINKDQPGQSQLLAPKVQVIKLSHPQSSELAAHCLSFLSACAPSELIRPTVAITCFQTCGFLKRLCDMQSLVAWGSWGFGKSFKVI